MASPIYTAPSDSPPPVLGKTLVDIVYDTARKYQNPRLLNQPTNGTWKPFSLEEFRNASEEIGVGLRVMGLDRGDKVALYMDSDAYFCLADMGCLVAGCVDVPIYVTHTADSIAYVLDHSESRAVFVSSQRRLNELAEVLPEVHRVRWVIVADTGGQELSLPPGLPNIDVLTMEQLRERGRTRINENADVVQQLVGQVKPADLATLIYTSGTTGRPKGVMLTHFNMVSNVLQASSWFDIRPGKDVMMCVLPFFHSYGLQAVLNVGIQDTVNVNAGSTDAQINAALPRFGVLGFSNPKWTGPYRFQELAVDAYGDPGEPYAASTRRRMACRLPTPGLPSQLNTSLRATPAATIWS
jgi:long-chain acyl-CoA synthetase